MERNLLQDLSFTELLKVRDHFIEQRNSLFAMPGMPPTDPALNKELKSFVEEIDNVIFKKFQDLKSGIRASFYDPN